jgi:hypothetical protein
MRRVAVVLLVSIAASAPALLAQRGTAAAALRFTNVTRASGISFTNVNGASPDKYLAETMGSGAALLDFDADGWVDLLLVDGGSIADPAVASRARHRLYRNAGGTFVDVTGASGIRHRDYGMGACAGDVDNDARPDIYITSYGANTLYRNAGKGAFTDVTAAAGVGLGGWSTSCAFLDIDLDGDLDLWVVNYLDAARDNNRFCGDPQRRVRVYCHPLNYRGLPSVLYRNDGRGTFTDVSTASGIAGFAGNGLGIAVGDYDDDGRPDVFVANDGVPNFLFHNEGGGRFTEVGLPAGVSVARDGKARAGMGTEFADYNGDGRLDLIVTNHEFETHSLFRNDGNGIFSDATVESGLSAPTLPWVGFGVAFFDADNNGDLDLAIVNGHVIDNTAQFRAGSSHAQPRLLFRSAGGRRFAEVGREAGPGFAGPGVGRTLVAGDLDNDGDIDLVTTANGGAAEVLRNESTGGGAALIVQLAGARHREAMGARITVAAGGRTQMREVKSGSSYLGQNDLRLHVGLGAAARAEQVRIRWPGGVVETLRDVAAGQIITVTEGKGITARMPF